MCGLFGVVALERPLPEAARLSAARDRLRHRGPDQAGAWAGGPVWMGHRRLSILDLSENGRQPMTDAGSASAEDGQVAITVNGEIYNFRALRRDLEAEGMRFRSNSDSEVVLHGYLAWGIDRLLERIDGMYAIAIADLATGQLHLARDRPGIKPLYHTRRAGLFAWASEPAALLDLFRDDPPGPDPLGLVDFLTYRYIPAPRSAWQGIAKLPPAHLLTLDLATGALQEARYWQLPEGAEATEREAETEEALRALIAESVAEQRVADVPLGLFLSGGVDSGILAHEAAAAGDPPETFTIDFADGSGGGASGEGAQAAATAAHVGAVNHLRTLAPEPGLDLAAWMLALYGEPFADDSALPTWHVSAHARSRVTVALAGDGGDELFGGYRWYRDVPRRAPVLQLAARAGLSLPKVLVSGAPSGWRRPAATLDRALTAARREPALPALANALFITRVGPDARRRWRAHLEVPADYDELWFFRAHWQAALPTRRALRVLDFHTFLPESVLTKVDRASMAHALEVRVPFLSRALIEFAFRLPECFIHKGGALKGGLLHAYRDKLPAALLSGPKRGFGLPAALRRHGLEEAMLARFLAHPGPAPGPSSEHGSEPPHSCRQSHG